MFVTILRYLKPLPEIDAFVEEHRQFLQKHYDAGDFIVSGVQVPRNGGIILVRAENRDAVLKIMSGDPFFKNKVAEYQIIEFNPTRHAKGFEQWLS